MKIKVQRQKFLEAVRAIGFTAGDIFMEIEGGYVRIYSDRSKQYGVARI